MFFYVFFLFFSGGSLHGAGDKSSRCCNNRLGRKCKGNPSWKIVQPFEKNKRESLLQEHGKTATDSVHVTCVMDPLLAQNTEFIRLENATGSRIDSQRWTFNPQTRPTLWVPPLVNHRGVKLNFPHGGSCGFGLSPFKWDSKTSKKTMATARAPDLFSHKKSATDFPHRY